MRIALALLIANTSAIKVQKQWPSVARCMPGVVSTDEFECDQANPSYHATHLDNTTGIPAHPLATPLLGKEKAALAQKTWPSVARCAEGQISSDEFPCDHSAPPNHLHKHDNVTGASPHPLATPLLGSLVQIDAAEAARIVSQWPSVARCDPLEVPDDENPCDASNEFRRHNHDLVIGLDPHALATPIHQIPQQLGRIELLQTQEGEQWRPRINCKDPEHGNPVTCGYDDVTSLSDSNKKNIWNAWEQKTIVGGPLVSWEPVVDAVGKDKAAAQKDSLKGKVQG